MTQSSPDVSPARASGAHAAQGTAAPVAIVPVPPGGSRITIDEQDGRTVITSAALPPELMPLAHMAKDTALGLMGLLAAIVILGPFARMLARRMERRPEVKAAENQAQMLQQQLQQLQASMDVMALEVERISEAQRFQSKLLSERKSASPV